MPERKLRSLLAVTSLVLLTLAVLPATRWLLRLQVGALTHPAFLADNREARERHMAESNPGDYQTQVAYALSAPLTNNNTPSELRIQRLNALAAQFPNEPSLYAHLLRYYASGSVGIHRADEDELAAEPVKRTGAPKFSNPADLAAFDAAAAQGERLDPDNAYFPFMRTTELYEAHRDTDAIAALHRAGQKTRFEDYSGAEFTATDRFYTAAHGRQGGINRVSQAAMLLFPHFALVRGTARLSTVSAIHAELEGNPALGVQIRHDTMRVGDLMRVQGHSLIANLVGIAITAIPQSRPGGAPAVKSSSDVTMQTQRDQLIAARREKYYTYLRSIGRDDEARYAKAALEAGVQSRNISSKSMAEASEHGPFATRSLAKTGLWWMADMLTLANAFGLLLLGGLAMLAAKARPTQHLNVWRGAFAAATVAGFGLLAANVNHLAADMYATPLQIMNLTGNSPQDSSLGEFFMRFVGTVLALGFPLLLAGVVGIVSLKSRTSFVENLSRWARVLAVPMACGLLLLYSLLLLGTARQEAQLSAGLGQMLTHEASYNASLVGLKWPGEAR